MRICILGSEAAGKTCFLGGLAILSEPNRHSAVHVVGADQADESGSPSQRFLNDVARALRAREWPPPTTLTRDVALDVRFRDRLMRITAIDYAGENFREALNDMDDSRQRQLIEHMLTADYLLLMLDPVFDLPEEPTQHMHERQNAQVSGIRKIYEDAHKKKRELPCVGLVVTKADLVPGLRGGDPERFVQERGGALLEKIRAWGVETACFAVSAVGDVEMLRGEDFVRPAAALQPFGYDAVFDWVLESNQRRKRQRVMRRYVAPAVVFVFAFVLGMFLQTKHAAKIVPDTSKDLEERVAAANSAWFGVGDAADSMVADELGKMRERYEALESAVELNALRGRFEILKELKHTSRGRDIAEFERVLGEADRKLSYQRIKGMSPEDPDLKAASEAFLKRFPGAAEAHEVAGILSALRGRQDQNDREKVRRVTVVNGDRESLNRKAASIMEYVIAHPEAELVEEMRRAAEAARRLASSDTLKVRLLAGGVFKQARRFRLAVFMNAIEVKRLESDGELKRATWDEVCELHGWVPGAKVEVKVWDLHFLNELVGSRVDTDALSVKLLGGKHALENDPGFGGHYMDGGHFEVTSEIEGFSEGDWAALEKFVAPGLAW